MPEIVRLLGDDVLGRKRDRIGDEIAQSYYDAFDAINSDENHLLILADIEGQAVGTFQISFIPYMSFMGALRAIVEAVHVDNRYRNLGIGQKMMRCAIKLAKARGCRLMQLTSNKQRKDAHRFYVRLGFMASHEGFKLDLIDR
ncbi:MAG: GNAT family N-acetyltransferase [Alphaproteobacteria bacterium]